MPSRILAREDCLCIVGFEPVLRAGVLACCTADIALTADRLSSYRGDSLELELGEEYTLYFSQLGLLYTEATENSEEPVLAILKGGRSERDLFFLLLLGRRALLEQRGRERERKQRERENDGGRERER